MKKLAKTIAAISAAAILTIPANMTAFIYITQVSFIKKIFRFDGAKIALSPESTK